MTPREHPRMPRVSVVVPTYRRPALLARCLEALAQQDLDASDYEVVVPDDAGTEDAQRVVERAAATARTPVRYVPVEGCHGPAAARNAGWRAARARIIAFTDDDCIPSAGWLRAGLAAFTPEVTGVQGRLIVPQPPVPTDYEKNAGRLAEGEFVTANCFYRRDALAAVGGFDERFRVAWREDSDLFFTLCERGGTFRRAPDAVVVHPVRPGRFAVSLREQRKSMFNALLYKKHPSLYRRRIQPAPPWRSYATLAAATGALAAASLRQPRWAAASGAVWLALTARFCARRLDGTSRSPRHIAEMVLTSAAIPSLSAFWRLRGALRYRVPFL